MKPIPGYEGRYSITESGGVYSHLSNKWLRAGDDSRGYLHVCLRKDDKTYDHKVHRLVALTYHGPSELTVNHKDGDKRNNHPDNLEYVTRGDNLRHAFTTGLNPTKRPKRIVGVCMQGTGFGYYYPTIMASREKFNPSTVNAAVLGKRNHHKGYYWSEV